MARYEVGNKHIFPQINLLHKINIGKVWIESGLQQTMSENEETLSEGPT